jgi:hypothetical protein
MLYFLRDMSTMAGRQYKAGRPVPDSFSSPTGIAEMIRAGDIIDIPEEIPVVEIEKEIEETESWLDPEIEPEVVKVSKKKTRKAK